MKISESLRKEMECDIEQCENYSDRKGSETLYSRMIAKYSVIDPSFKTNISISGKATVPGIEFDYRPELKAVAEKIRMILLLTETSHTQNGIEP